MLTAKKQFDITYSNIHVRPSTCIM